MTVPPVLTGVDIAIIKNVASPTVCSSWPRVPLASATLFTMATTPAGTIRGAWFPFQSHRYPPQSSLSISVCRYKFEHPLAPLPIASTLPWRMQWVPVEEANKIQTVLECPGGKLAGWLAYVARLLSSTIMGDRTKAQLPLNELQDCYITLSHRDCHARVSMIPRSGKAKTAVPIDKSSEPVSKAIVHVAIIPFSHGGHNNA